MKIKENLNSYVYPHFFTCFNKTPYFLSLQFCWGCFKIQSNKGNRYDTYFGPKEVLNTTYIKKSEVRYVTNTVIQLCTSHLSGQQKEKWCLYTLSRKNSSISKKGIRDT